MKCNFCEKNIKLEYIKKFYSGFILTQFYCPNCKMFLKQEEKKFIAEKRWFSVREIIAKRLNQSVDNFFLDKREENN